MKWTHKGLSLDNKCILLYWNWFHLLWLYVVFLVKWS